MDQATVDIERALAPLHARYNEREKMIRRPFSSPGYHTTLKGGWVHPTRDSLNYALLLLDSGNEEYLRRAEAIIGRVIALQDQRRDSRTHGIWSWFLEEPLPAMSPPDWNWADFCGAALLQALVDHGDRLTPATREAMKQSLRHACESILKRDVGPGYTNIAVMGAFVTLVSGERLGWKDMEEYGVERVRRFHAFTMETGWFHEYNSPTYTVVAIEELGRLQHYARHVASRRQVDELMRIAWREIAEHFHPPSRQWTGPHSRAYSTLMSQGNLAFIQRAAAGRIDLGVKHSQAGARVPIRFPAEIDTFFTRLDTPRLVKRNYSSGPSPLSGTTWLSPGFALGTIDRGEMWNQRRNLVAYWGKADAPAYLHLRVLRDGYDFSAATFHSAQAKGTAVFSLTFSTDGGNTHRSLDRLANGTFTASDLRIRFELGGAAAASRIPLPGKPGDVLAFDAAGLPVTIQILHHAFSPGQARWETVSKNGTLGLDLVLWSGAEQSHNMATWDTAAIVMAVELDAKRPSPLRQTQKAFSKDGGTLSLSHGEFLVDLPLKPTRQRALLSKRRVVLKSP